MECVVFKLMYSLFYRKRSSLIVPTNTIPSIIEATDEVHSRIESLGKTSHSIDYSDEVYSFYEASDEPVEPPKTDAHAAQALFSKRTMLGSYQDYSEAIIAIIKAIQNLNTYSSAEFSSAINNFNHAFAENIIPVSVNNIPIDAYSIDYSLIKKMKQTLTDSSKTPLQINILQACLSVYNEMNKQRSNEKLVYNQPRRAAEMFMDLHCLLFQENSSYKEMNLLVMLCGLFHNVVYNRKLIHDEKDSAKRLTDFLSPLKIDAEDKKIIENLINILITGIALASFEKDNNDKKFLTIDKNDIERFLLIIENLFEVSSHLLQKKNKDHTENPNYIAIAYFSRILADIDMQRTSIPLVYANNTPYKSPSWTLIEKNFYTLLDKTDLQLKLSLQRKLTQSLRMIFENIAKNNTFSNKLLTPLFEYASQYQANANCKNSFSCQEAYILAFAGTIKDEIKFVKSMQHNNNLSQKRPYEFENTWKFHAIILENIHQYLTSNNIDSQAKESVIMALTHVAADQDGQDFSVEKILEACNSLQKHINHVVDESTIKRTLGQEFQSSVLNIGIR